MDDGTGTPIRPATVLATAIGLTSSPGSASPMQTTAPATGLTANGDAESSGSERNGVCVFSGGTAANSLVDAYHAVAKHLSTDNDEAEGSRHDGSKKPPCALTYIIPISDNGGSSSELIRFFGGPSVGDVRSRLVRLIPSSDGEGNERAALRALFEHRLCASDPNQARSEWLDLVEARHLLWTFVPSATRELIRAVLNTLNLEIVKRARPSTSVFNFAGASVGNLFLTGARLFSGSFEAGIYLLSLLCGIPDHVTVLPAINSNFTHHISAGLVDGTTIAGQVNISHPSLPTSLPDGGPLTVGATGGGGTDGTGEAEVVPEGEGGETPLAPVGGSTVLRKNPKARKRASTAVDFEDATLPGSLPVLRQPQIAFSKEDEEDLPSRIARIWYINPYGHEIRPQANPKALVALRKAEAIIYSIGSLYTSIIPSLVLRGVGAAISCEGSVAGLPPRKKVFILNSKLDRETGPSNDAMTAVDFVKAIVAACKQSQSDFSPVEDNECQKYVTHLIYLDTAQHGSEGSSTAPKVNEMALSELGIQCLAVSSQANREKQSVGEGAAVASKKATERYDQEALTEALKGLLDGSLDRKKRVQRITHW